MENLTAQQLNKLMMLLIKDTSDNEENEKSNDELWNKLWEMKREVI